MRGERNGQGSGCSRFLLLRRSFWGTVQEQKLGMGKTNVAGLVPRKVGGHSL
jgi:hypothetical protein